MWPISEAVDDGDGLHYRDCLPEGVSRLGIIIISAFKKGFDKVRVWLQVTHSKLQAT